MNIDNHKLRDDSLEQVAAYVGYRPWREFCAVRRLIEAAKELRGAPVEFEDERISYVTVQVSKALLEEFDAALAALEHKEAT